MGKSSDKELLYGIPIIQGFSICGGHYIRTLSVGKPLLYTDSLHEVAIVLEFPIWESLSIKNLYVGRPLHKHCWYGESII